MDTDLDVAADELYAAPPEEFVGRRTALVKRARQDRDRALATAIGALRKPTRTAWLVNLLAREAPADVAALLQLGESLRTAQAERDGAALRRLSTERRRSIDALTRRAAELAREHGHEASESTTAEVASTLQAALGEPEVAEQVRRGRLASGVVYGGFGGFGGFDVSAPAAEPEPEPAAPPEDEVGRRRRAALQQARDDATRAWEQARTEADEATRRADELAEQVDRLRTELEQAEQAEQEARAGARAARQRVHGGREAADVAETALREGTADL